MSASSFILVVVIAIWAAYLLLYVTRRREHLATARSVDRFSAHMRVLQRRAGSSRTPAARTSSVSLVRAAPTTSPYDGQAKHHTATRTHLLHPATPPRSARPAQEAPRQVAAVGINRGFALLGRLTSVPEAKVRQVASLTGAVGMTLTLLGAVFGLVSWGWFVVSLVAVIAVLMWSRSRATAARAVMTRRGASLRVAHGLGDAFMNEAPGADSDVDLVSSGVSRAARRPSRDDVYDFTQVHSAPAARTGSGSGDRDPGLGAGLGALDPLGATPGWAPVPVPLPTYAMKARAEHPLPTPLDVPVPIEIDDEFDLWQRTTRAQRAAVNG